MCGLFLVIGGCFGQQVKIIHDEVPVGFSNNFAEIALSKSAKAETLLYWPDDKNIKLRFDYSKFDINANTINPLVKLQMQDWQNDTTGAWFNLSQDEGEYSVKDDTLTVFVWKLEPYFRKRNLRFRARTEYNDFYSDYVKLPHSLRIVPAGEAGIPLQPNSLQLIK